MKEITLRDNIEILQPAYIKNKQSVEQQPVSFGEMLKNSLNEVNDLKKNAGRSIKEISYGKEKDIHNTMIAMEKASVSFQLLMQVRNKIVSAYDEIKRMQI